MNRRDVIIIAVLVNAGLLVVLFASALKSSKDQPQIAVQTEPRTNTSSFMHNDVPSPRGDEVDQVLSQFAVVNSPPQSLATPLLEPAPQSPQQPLTDLQPLPNFSHEIPNLSTSTSTFSSSASEEKNDSSFKEVKVKKGDALEKIARTHNTTVQDIMRMNHLSSTQLKIGQVLKIPSKNGKVMPTESTVVSVSPSETKYYVVKNGDNPWTIAVKNHMKVDELLKLNGLDEEKARKLKPGDQLRIR